jgi:peptidoglycan/xylan/chitin deacetylase (PgdA/CDA1 family)
MKRIGTFIRPDALMEKQRLASGRINLLVSFDDGFVNHCRLALPVLQRHNVPAMFFISTWHMENREPFWFDRLIRPIQQHQLVELDLRHLGLGSYRFSPSGGEDRWNGLQLLLEDVKRHDPLQKKIVECILDEMEKELPYVRRFHQDDLPLSGHEILAMRDSGLCWIGSHAHRHRILTKLDDEELAEELQKSRNILESLLDQPVEHIAYPNGNADARVREACRRAGYRFGFTVEPGRVRPTVDHFRIPRIVVGGFDTSYRLLFNLACGLLTRERGSSSKLVRN